MTVINKFDSTDFLQYLLSQIERIEDEGGTNNYRHTHDRVWFDPKTSEISFNEVCINDEGSVFDIGVSGKAIIPKEWATLLPGLLQQSPNWMDV